MLIRGGFTHGLNFDITVGFDLRKEAGIEYMWSYIDRRKPNIILLSNPCTMMKGFKGSSRVKYPEAYHKARMLSVPFV